LLRYKGSCDAAAELQQTGNFGFVLQVLADAASGNVHVMIM